MKRKAIKISEFVFASQGLNMCSPCRENMIRLELNVNLIFLGVLMPLLNTTFGLFRGGQCLLVKEAGSAWKKSPIFDKENRSIRNLEK